LNKLQFGSLSKPSKIGNSDHACPLSVDLQRIMAAYEAKEGSQRQPADRFKVSLSSSEI